MINNQVNTIFAVLIILLLSFGVGAYSWISSKSVDTICDLNLNYGVKLKERLNPGQFVSNDKDEHGCIGSAGYKWNEEKQECLRNWEESCSDISNWKTYKNDKYGFEFKYPYEWERYSPIYVSLNKEEIALQDFFVNQKTRVLNVSLEKNIDNKSVLAYANYEIRVNKCSGELQDQNPNCPENGPVDHIIKSSDNGILYSLYCFASSESYVYVTKDNSGNILRFDYKDDFNSEWCETEKIQKFNKIVSTLRFVK